MEGLWASVNYILIIWFVGNCQASEASTVVQRKAPVSECPRNWTRYDRTKSCFLLNEQRLKWNDAKRHCGRLGAHLASITDEYENTFLFEFARKANLSVPTVWLGKIVRTAKNGAFEWSDGALARYGAGFRGGENVCITMWLDYHRPEGSWNEWDCDYPSGYASVCKKGFKKTSTSASSNAATGVRADEGAAARSANASLAHALTSGTHAPPPGLQHASKRCCLACPQKCGPNERCIPDDLNCLIKTCNGTASGWCLPQPVRR